MSDVLEDEIKEFAKQLPYPLDPFQLSACRALLNEKSVLVAAPTGAGKTTIAEFAIWLSQTKQGRVVYTAPIKALSNQKFNELVALYGEEEVGLLTGDVHIRNDAPILVMTTEVLRNMIYEGEETLADLTHVILDEVHYLADRFRGAVWEEIILHLPQHIKLVSLSATVSNSEEFGEWLQTVRGETEVIVSEIRPVPLFQHVFTDGRILPLFTDADGEVVAHGRLNKRLIRMEKNVPFKGRDFKGRSERRRPPRNRTNHRDLIFDLEDAKLLPAIVFIFSRNRCDQAVRAAVQSGVRLTTKEERNEIRALVREQTKTISKTDLKALGFRGWLAGLEHGVAAHHAGLIPPFKSIVETLFQKKLLKVVFATETLALGINMPAKSVVIDQLSKFNGESEVPLSSGEFAQLTGRAGRRGIDTEGHAVVVWEHKQDLDFVASLASKRVYPLRSSFRPTYNMSVNLLERLSFETAKETLEKSFAQFQTDKNMVTLAKEVQAKRASLAGYQKAIQKNTGAEKKKWISRTKKLENQLRKNLRYLDRRTGTISRVFQRLVLVLQRLDYVEKNGEQPKPTWRGEILRNLFGERDLLVSECLLDQTWLGLNPAELGALFAALVYEPRRDDEYTTVSVPGRNFQAVFSKTLDLWAVLDGLEEENHLVRTEPPHPGISAGMIRWARGAELEEVLDETGLGAGDFIRVTKQTIDLLEQVSKLKKIVNTHEGVPEKNRLFIAALADQAAAAKKLLDRGIIELTSRVEK